MHHLRRNSSYLPIYHNMPAPYHSVYGVYPASSYLQPPIQLSHMHAQQYMSTPHGGKNLPSQLFHNPLQTEDQFHTQHQGGYTQAYHVTHLAKPPAGQFGSILNSFKSQSGSLDLNKMMDTAGQMMNALTQVTNMAKGLGGLFKS